MHLPHRSGVELNKFYNSGHMMFYYESNKFNECISRFIDHVAADKSRGLTEESRHVCGEAPAFN